MQGGEKGHAREGKGYIAVSAYKGSLAEAKKVPEGTCKGEKKVMRGKGGKGYTAVPAYKGSLAVAREVPEGACKVMLCSMVACERGREVGGFWHKQTCLPKMNDGSQILSLTYVTSWQLVSEGGRWGAFNFK
eukprot:1153458-Pelagomonas_calceolata.AAC.2